jgi:hypothetical protein
MSRHGRTRLVPPKTEPKNEVIETTEETGITEPKEEAALSELDMEIECPRCNEIMGLHSKFDELMYSCENCNFLLKCV